ncbi:toprim domain-containing protein [Mesomycoplasma conjunctivae]|uniref:toprim domain-containing protein n=1 Tax=Mesomycoplasma conjunctivae TaxID=45361 RepID=UPI003DA3DD07
MYGNDFEELAKKIKILPGVGKKQSEKILHFLLDAPIDDINIFIEELYNLKKNFQHCRQCNFVSRNRLCSICLDAQRENKILVVENSDIVAKFENSGEYKGRYFVLGDFNIKNLSALDDKINQLKIMANNDSELILGISSTLDGLIVTSYITKHEVVANLKISQLATGIPFGANIDYLDKITLQQALKNRRETEK